MWTSEHFVLYQEKKLKNPKKCDKTDILQNLVFKLWEHHTAINLIM